MITNKQDKLLPQDINSNPVTVIVYKKVTAAMAPGAEASEQCWLPQATDPLKLRWRKC